MAGPLLDRYAATVWGVCLKPPWLPDTQPPQLERLCRRLAATWTYQIHLEILLFQWVWNSGYWNRASLVKSRHGTMGEEKRCFCACFCLLWWPLLLLLMKMPGDRRLGTSALLYLWLYTFTIIIHSLLSLSRNTHMWAHTLKTKNTELSPLRKNEANFIPSLKHK